MDYLVFFFFKSDGKCVFSPDFGGLPVLCCCALTVPESWVEGWSWRSMVEDIVVLPWITKSCLRARKINSSWIWLTTHPRRSVKRVGDMPVMFEKKLFLWILDQMVNILLVHASTALKYLTIPPREGSNACWIIWESVLRRIVRSLGYDLLYVTWICDYCSLQVPKLRDSSMTTFISNIPSTKKGEADKFHEHLAQWFYETAT